MYTNFKAVLLREHSCVQGLALVVVHAHATRKARTSWRHRLQCQRVLSPDLGTAHPLVQTRLTLKYDTPRRSIVFGAAPALLPDKTRAETSPASATGRRL